MKKFKKFVCAALVAAVSACAVPTYQADAASISQLQQKRQNLASSTKKAKQEIANIKNKKLSAEQEMEAMDKVRDASTSHERCSIIEVMGRSAGYIALWCGIANGAEDILLPEKYDYDEQKLVNNIIEKRKHGKKHHIIVNAEGIGHSASMAKRIEAATGIETRATILGHMQRGGSPTAKDRVYASTMGALAVDLLCEGKTNRVVGYRHGAFVDFDIDEALAMKKEIPEYEYQIAKNLSI